MAAGSLRTALLTLAAVTAAYPSSNYTPIDARDYDENAGSTYDRVDTGTVPASSPYRMYTELKPLRNFGMTITVGGASRTIVQFGTQASGQVGVDWSSGLLEFHSSDAGGSASVTYRGVGTLIDATRFNLIQKEVVAVQTSCTGKVTGPGSATDNAITRFDGTTGKLVQNSGATIDDSGNVTATNISGSTSGTNTGDVTLNTALNSNLLSITGQVLGLDTQSANLVFAGPASGSAAVPTFRALGDDDLGSTSVAFTNVENNWTEAQTFPGIVGSRDQSVGPPVTSWATGGTGGVVYPILVGQVSETTLPLNRRVHRFTALATAGATTTYDHRLPDVSGTVPMSATSPIAINSTTGDITLGTVPIANGGTNSTATPTAGAVAYGTGTAFAFNSAGTSGYLLASGGSGAPTFVEPYEKILETTPGTTNIFGSNKTYSVPAGTLSANGDEIELVFHYWNGVDPITLSFAGTTIGTLDGYSAEHTSVRVRVVRISNTEVRTEFIVWPRAGASTDTGQASVTSLNLTTTAYNLRVATTDDTDISMWRVTKRRGT